MDAFTFDLSNIDPSDLQTDHHIRKVAEELVPAVLRQMGEEKGQIIWEAALQIANADGADLQTDDRNEYVRRMADAFIRHSTPDLHDRCRRTIERRLRQLSRGYISLPPNGLGVTPVIRDVERRAQSEELYGQSAA